jgi:hypothetical protein
MQLKSAGRLCEELRLENRDQFLAVQNVLRPLEHEVSLADAACKKQEERVGGLTEELRFLSPKNTALKKWGATLLTELSTGSKQSGAKSQKKGKQATDKLEKSQKEEEGKQVAAEHSKKARCRNGHFRQTFIAERKRERDRKRASEREREEERERERERERENRFRSLPSVVTWRLCVPEQLRTEIDQSNGGAGGAGEGEYALCALTNVDLRKMTVASLTKRLVESPDINAQQIRSVLKNRYNVLSKNTTKELLAHECARTVGGVVARLVDGGVGMVRVAPPEELGGGWRWQSWCRRDRRG